MTSQGKESTTSPPAATATRHEATVWRKKPDFDTEDAREKVRTGLVVGPVSLFSVVYFGVTFWDAISHSKAGLTWLGLFLTPLIVLQAVMSVQVLRTGVEALAKKRAWIGRTASSRATVVGKSADYVEDSYYTGHWDYDLVLRMDADAAVAEFGDQWVGARVSKRIYGRYEFGERVHVYYSVEHPLRFLIRGE